MQAAVAACDTSDGEGTACSKIPSRASSEGAVGTNTDWRRVFEQDAAVVRAIWEGPSGATARLSAWTHARRDLYLSGVGAAARRGRTRSRSNGGATLNEEWSPLTLTRAAYEHSGQVGRAVQRRPRDRQPDLSAFGDAAARCDGHGQSDPADHPGDDRLLHARGRLRAAPTRRRTSIGCSAWVGYCGGAGLAERTVQRS